MTGPLQTEHARAADLRAVVAELEVRDDATPQLLPTAAYCSPEVLAWERRALFAGGWTCLGRLADLLPRGTTQRAVAVGDVGCLLTAASDDAGPDSGAVRMFANTCRHRAHELLPDGGMSSRRSVVCPYHAWTYDLTGRLRAAPGFRDDPRFDPDDHGLVELPVATWSGWLFGHAGTSLAAHRIAPEVAPFEQYVGALDALLAAYDIGSLVVAERHTYQVAANWKVIAENYHECYHCPLIHPELCQVSPPDSGANYDLPGAWIGGSMDLRDGVGTMSMDGGLTGTPLPGVDLTRVEYLHLLPNLFVSAHPDYVLTHRLVPLAPDRTWVECSWLVPPAPPGGTVVPPRSAVDFWDLTNRQDWAACESVQRGLANPYAEPGPLAPQEDAVAQLVDVIGTAYRTGALRLGPLPT